MEDIELKREENCMNKSALELNYYYFRLRV